jgi:hypothetical protein
MRIIIPSQEKCRELLQVQCGHEFLALSRETAGYFLPRKNQIRDNTPETAQAE